MARVVSGVLLAAAFFAIVWYANTVVLLCVALAVAALAFHEYAELVRQLGAHVPRWLSLAATLAAIVVVPFAYVPVEAVLGVGLVAMAINAMARMTPGPPGAAPTPHTASSPFVSAALSVLAGAFAPVYIGLALGALVAIHLYGGRGAVVLLVATIAISDTAQYYSGRTFGRRPLAARLSPKKTIEGAIGGFLVTPLFVYVATPFFMPPAPPLQTAAIGVVLVVCGIAGDLFESMLKRAADMKDSAALIPGHGGVLDRIDALLFATPVFYLYVRWIYAV